MYILVSVYVCVVYLLEIVLTTPQMLPGTDVVADMYEAAVDVSCSLFYMWISWIGPLDKLVGSSQQSQYYTYTG